MAVPTPSAAVPVSDLGSYQHAVRLVLTYDVITASRPRVGTLELALRWADQMAADFRELLGYTLIATTRQVRLSRRIDALDPTQSAAFPRATADHLTAAGSLTCAWSWRLSSAPGWRSAWPTWYALSPRQPMRSTASASTRQSARTRPGSSTCSTGWRTGSASALRRLGGSMGKRHRTRRRTVRHRPRHLRCVVPACPPGAAPDQCGWPAGQHVRGQR